MSVWDTETGEIETQLAFDRELLGLSVHPSGLFVLVTTLDAVCLLGMYVEEPRMRELGRVRAHKSSMCEFANCDDVFAFVCGTVIRVYGMMRLEQLGAIRTHELGRLKQIKFVDFLSISLSLRKIFGNFIKSNVFLTIFGSCRT